MEQYLFLALLLITLGLTADNWRRLRCRTLRSGATRRMLLDTSVLIDGRILELAKTGWLNDELVIPRSVLSELQLLADGANADKRARARYGMDVVAELQRVEQVMVTILPDNRNTPEGVDNRLLELARQQGFALATIDYNLNKIAVVEGVTVLNINELAKVIRLQVLPGEHVKIKLIQDGQGKDQAVGYLEDGAMVVVAHAKKHIGEIIEVEISRALQTDAGKMIFAELLKKPTATPESTSNRTATAKPKKLLKQSTVRPKTRKAQSSNQKAIATIKPKAQKLNQPKKAINTTQTPKRRTHKPKTRQDEYLERIISTTSSKQ